MTNDFGPWTTTLESGTRAPLSTFWKRRITMLPVVWQSNRALSRQAAMRLLALAVAAIGVPGMYLSQVPAADANAKIDDAATPLADAVRAFNAEAAENPIGKTQPPLTEDEVIAALRGILRELTPMTDEVYNAYQKIAETRTLPPRATLHFTIDWVPRLEGFHFTVWWADLSIMTGKHAGYNYRLRDCKISSRPLTDEELEAIKSTQVHKAAE
jgi:hypothetical protein